MCVSVACRHRVTLRTTHTQTQTGAVTFWGSGGGGGVHQRRASAKPAKANTSPRCTLDTHRGTLRITHTDTHRGTLRTTHTNTHGGTRTDGSRKDTVGARRRLRAEDAIDTSHLHGRRNLSLVAFKVALVAVRHRRLQWVVVDEVDAHFLRTAQPKSLLQSWGY
jgi:hypothetical protein